MGASRSDIHSSVPEESIEFGQENLANSIEDEIERDHNTHIAVNGPWGSGKTTVLKYAMEKIKQEDSEVISLWYEPWRYGPDQTTLRRTFLESLDEAVADELDTDPVVETENYHFDNIDFKTKNLSTFLKDVSETFRSHAYFIILLFLIIAATYFIGSLIGIAVDSGIGRLVGSAISSVSLFLFVTLIFYMRRDLARDLAEETTFDIKEPKISEIDLFEEYYQKILKKAGDNDKRIVVFIDDVDRCNSEEIREVITGLSTYLNPDHKQVDVAFVAAIDGPKIIKSFEPEKNKSQVNPNILNKTFQVILPVPTPSKEDIVKLVEKTTEDLAYPISDDDIERISSISIAYADSNLRIIRSALCEVQWMKEFGEENMIGNSYEKTKSFDRIMNSDFNLYRIALIKLLSKDKDLRKLVTEADNWINKNKQLDIKWEIFEVQSKFAPGNLDPRPFLGLNSPNEYVADVHDYDDIRQDIEADRLEEARDKWEKYDESSKLHIAYSLLDRDMTSIQDGKRARNLKGIKELLLHSQSLLNEKRYNIFSECMELYDNSVLKKTDPAYEDWLFIANEIGEKAINQYISADNIFYQRDKRSFLDKLCVESGSYGPEVIDRILKLEIELVEKNVERSVNRTKQIFGEESISESRKAPDYILTVLENWDFDKHKDGPNQVMFDKAVMNKLQSNEYEKRAETMYSAEIPAGEFKKKLKQKGWPIPREDDEN